MHAPGRYLHLCALVYLVYKDCDMSSGNAHEDCMATPTDVNYVPLGIYTPVAPDIIIADPQRYQLSGNTSLI